ncbi:MAG: sulfite exporter TauE/SafE family protein [Actinobacteria bacterium]|nr:sulfite exporter TauE/SafE family protein [Actinomycetota bacterium]MDQ3532169.1 sulfite exporter TauE/SafE family protein [Actinomycetota bacterium]
MMVLGGLGILVVGIVTGILSALLGVGGGIVMVPFMVLVLGLGQQLAEGTSLLVIIPTAVAGVLAHRRSGYLSVRVGLMVGAGGVAGSFFGARLALVTPDDVLQKVFGIVLAIAGARLLRSGIKSRRAG